MLRRASVIMIAIMTTLSLLVFGCAQPVPTTTTTTLSAKAQLEEAVLSSMRSEYARENIKVLDLDLTYSPELDNYRGTARGTRGEMMVEISVLVIDRGDKTSWMATTR